MTTDYLVGRVDDMVAAAPSGELYRQLEQLSDRDRQTIKVLVDDMAKKGSQTK